MGTDLIELAVNGGCKGIVLEGLGGGRVPPAWIDAIKRAVHQDLPVVMTARVGAGRTVDRYGYAGAHRDLVHAGCWFAYGLNGQKARIKLMAALGTGVPGQYFDRD
jgi:L-asparaginase